MHFVVESIYFDLANHFDVTAFVVDEIIDND